ncbi:MAG: sugar transferase [Candidatus Woykebacteria bacterium]
MKSALKEVNKIGLQQRTDLYGVAEDFIKNFINQEFESDDAAEFFHWRETLSTKAIEPLAENRLGSVHLARMNNMRRVNKFLEQVNRTTPGGKYVVVCLETKDSRRTRILNKFPRVISRPYYALDFILKRVFPKWKPTYKIYFWLTKGKNRVISYTEAVGRLFSCGFEVKNSMRVGNLTYIIAQKTGEPAYDYEPTYGALVRLRRVGKDGRLFNVFKFRTMHPYSEYAQDYVFKMNNLEKGGKLKDDFRITGWGKIFRKLWIDELPMLYNWLRRDMKLVGVRPLSNHYYSLYPKDVQALRTSVKPGLLPPFYADMPETFDEIVESERVYLLAYLKNPIRTDVRYFFSALYNIFIKRARSV